MKKIVDISKTERVELEIIDGEQVGEFQILDGEKWVTKLREELPTDTVVDISMTLKRRWENLFKHEQKGIRPIRTVSGYPNPIR